MPLVVPDEAEPYILSHYLAGTSSARPYALRLYTNDETPDADSVLADFTEATAAGLEEVLLVGANWQTPTMESGAARSLYGTVALQFENESAGVVTVYGYFVVNAADDKLLWAERFADPEEMAVGGVLQVRPVFQMHSQY